MIINTPAQAKLVDPLKNYVMTYNSTLRLIKNMIPSVDFYEIDIAYVTEVVTTEGHLYGEIHAVVLFQKRTNSNQQYRKMIPRDPYNIDIPIPGEIVLCSRHPDQTIDVDNGINLPQYYYFGVLNILNSQNHNAVLAAYNPPVNQATIYDENSQLQGSYFKANKDHTSQLPYLQGDKLITGRYGHAIRFTSEYDSRNERLLPQIKISNNNQNCVINNTQSITESLDQSGTSLYMMYYDHQPKSNMIVLSSERNNLDKLHTFSLLGNSCILNSDRLLLNAKNSGIELFANKYIELSANQNIIIESPGETIISSDKKITLSSNEDINLSSKYISVEAQQQINLKSNQDIKLIANSITLGSQNATEPLVLGNQLVSLLQQLCTAISSITMVGNLGAPTSPPLNASQFVALSGRLSNILSTVSKIK